MDNENMIEFYKMSGSGNDFILIDDREDLLPVQDLKDFANRICARKISVGADGMIVIKKSEKADFRWRFFNADGSEAEMCGNGGRCAARFAFLKGIAGEKMSFQTIAGIIEAEIRGDVVKLGLTVPTEERVGYDIAINGRSCEVSSINTGVPHVIYLTDDLDGIDVYATGRAIRYHEFYKPAGTNANFLKVVDRHTIQIRTYERGVEDETLACGTGAVASALVSSLKGLVESPVNVLVKSGEVLKIYFDRVDGIFTKVYLEGTANVIYQGFLWEEAYK
jgi:diaminopimelate epimerase